MTAANFRFKKAEIGVFKEQTADAATNGFAKGCHIIGLTMGQFSLIDMIHSILKKQALLTSTSPHGQLASKTLRR